MLRTGSITISFFVGQLVSFKFWSLFVPVGENRIKRLQHVIGQSLIFFLQYKY
jgi:hypothetical protein